ncbi:MAG: hydrogenase expression/formation protein HypE [Cyanobacteriota bacterium]|jgi:hydrogenase expression/formation protein HypE|nr:hydrogenase expression/formation protein HypE [Cyanobacteriota bacterium]
MTGPPPERIRLAHGGGGTLMQELIARDLLPLYSDPALALHDAAALALPHGRLAFTTDSYVVQPLEFPGGDIGSLAVIGTANDLAMAGARPQALSLALILEEGLERALLRRLLASVAAAARACGLAVVTGDTKVVERGKADGLFITTSGIGLRPPGDALHPAAIRPGDQLLVSGDLGRHGIAIAAARHGLRLDPPLVSDCAPLWPGVQALLAAGVRPRVLRDLTRGGLASALHELAMASALALHVDGACLPVAPQVERTCALLGFEPLHLACEGRFVAVVAPEQRPRAEALLAPAGGAWVGEVAAGEPGVTLRSPYGGERRLLPLSGELLPRIC